MGRPWRDLDTGVLGGIALIGMGAFGALVVNGLLPHRTRVADPLEVEDLHCLGPLIDIYASAGTFQYRTGEMKRAQDALTRLLSRLKSSEANRLSEEHRALLRWAVRHSVLAGSERDADFVVAILKAFERIGDWRCVEQVEVAAARARNMRVRDAA